MYILTVCSALVVLGAVNGAHAVSITHQNPEMIAGIDGFETLLSMRDNATQLQQRSMSMTNEMSMIRRQDDDEPGEGALLCGNGKCVDGSCCGPTGVCGYGPDFCGEGCQSNCDAMAMCGRFSEGGSVKCGMDICCSWGGWCGTADVHCIGPNKWALCQEGFGKCEMIRPKRCGTGSGTTNGIKIGYYQANNVRYRLCNRIPPKAIKTEGYSHLYFSFASINPDSYEIQAWEEEDIPLMSEFTALKSDTLQTWIAVGGFSFSDPGPTQTTWSDLCSDSSRRAAFIASTKAFMDEYGFQGVDLDWEYPVAEDRGGSSGDIENFVSLLREMRESYGNDYGISLTLAPDYWYLRYFDAKGLEPYVDHFGFMAYDLHGFWDADVDALGSIVRGQADVREIYNNTIPLAYAGLDPGKIVFGVAWYGRGYTLSDPSCNEMGCGFKGPSNPAPCTNSAGVMSLVEIKKLIEDEGLEPRLNEGAMMKELTWDDQWIGYDDEETVAMKTEFANDMCFGGIMAWSIDFNSGTGGDEEPPASTDGTCGTQGGGAVCKGSGFGNCCSGSGWCGDSDAHCGSGCQGGDCIQGGETTDGSCGVGNNGAICGDWETGSCCSSSGWCGSGSSYCGSGCQSGPCDDDDDDGDDDDDDDPLPGTDPDLDWKAITCTHPAVIDASADADWRWERVRTEAAWNASVIEYWSNVDDGTALPFPMDISNFFNGPEMMQCHKLNAENGCGGLRLLCDDTNYPAGYFILNSFMGLNAMLWNFRNAITEVQVDISNEIIKFIDSFAPSEKDELSLAQVLDLVLLGWGATMAPTWNKWMSGWSWRTNNANDFGTLKDFTNDAVKGTITTVKDFTKTASEGLANVGTVSLQLQEMTYIWGNTTTQMSANLFAGTEESIKTLGKNIASGKMMDPRQETPSVEEMMVNIERAIYGLLIPQTWRSLPKNRYPFIVDFWNFCSKIDKEDAWWVDEDDFETILVCDPRNDRAYGIVQAPDPKENCKTYANPNLPTKCAKFSAPPGLKELDGEKWGGITKEDIYMASMNTFMDNDKKNRKMAVSYFYSDDLGVIEDIQEDAIRAPGFMDLPICLQREAFDNFRNWEMDAKGYHFPCNEEINYEEDDGPYG